jgi:bifunctional non-homologous end joining protein LigD
MTLDEYHAKRDFSRTREPAGQEGGGHAKPIFVVQEHHASHLHYDFRLEAEGVLKSWAVPKEPSMDPADKRLAVQVEDHPLDYAGFEGTIPEGHYGAGTVAIWDRGTYDNALEDRDPPQSLVEGIEAGHLEIVLHGERLRGKFALIRMKPRGRGKPQWLLIKQKDRYARSSGETTSPPKTRRNPRGERTEAPDPPQVRRKSSAARGKVTVTHPDRLMFPDAGLTKGDLFAYYGRIADRLLPFLKDRPVTLERLPEGLDSTDAPHFWQKNIPESFPDWIARVRLSTERGKAVDYALVNDRETLLYLVNQGTMTFHVWSSRVEDLDRPDFVLFDLDPGRARFADVVAVARELRRVLREEGVRSFVKTSGKTGLHVLTPWSDEGGFDEARDWAASVAEAVAGRLPRQATVEIRKAKRGERVYIDVLQNARGHHAVPPYVVRAVPGASVSTPLDWKEVTPALDPSSFNVKTIVRRLARRKTDPLAGLVRSFAGPRRRRVARK